MCSPKVPPGTTGRRAGAAFGPLGSSGSVSQDGSAHSGGSGLGLTGLLCRIGGARAAESDQRRVWYSPVRVSMRSVSPSFTNSGTVTMSPVSMVAFLRAPWAVSPA